MAKKTADKKTLARYCYTELNMQQNEIAEFVGTSPTQVTRWKNADKKAGIDWDALRSAHNLSSSKLIANYYQASQDIVDTAKEANRNLDSKETDQLNKLADAIKKLEKGLSVQTATLVLRKFNEHLIQHNMLDLAKLFADPQRDFVLNLMSHNE